MWAIWQRQSNVVIFMLDGMGVLCSILKDGEEAPGSEVKEIQREKPRSSILKMPQSGRPGTRAKEIWRLAIEKREFNTPEDYDKALQSLQLAERRTAFDAKAEELASEVEKKAAKIVQRIRNYDWENTHGKSVDAKGLATEKRAQGEHFLGNVDLINDTKLLEIAKRMPKGAHLHIHFNSCLPAQFLIQQARDIDAMYIRSTLPLTSRENYTASRISFMVMTPHEATHVKGEEKETYVPLGDITDIDYVSNRWMPYKQFQRQFNFVDENDARLSGTTGAEIWLERKMLISEDEAHGCSQTGRGTQMMKGLFAYESAFRNYTKECIKDFVKDNIQYAEIRPNFMATNSLKSDDGTRTIGNEGIMSIINEELHRTMQEIRSKGQYFGGMKVIYCTPRSFDRGKIEIALDECIDLKKKYQKLLCGFDLVGHEEMGNELRHFVPEFLAFRRKCRDQKLDIPFLFHCGETLEVGGKVDGNLFDAILLNAKRIGHGYAVARHPILMEIFKEKKIAIESCPISNEVLGLTPSIAGHNLPVLLANDVPLMIGSESMSLHGWKQLAEWSLEYSCMDDEEKKDVTKEWTTRWRDYCQWIVDKYSWVNEWTPASDRH
ncbi:putative adenosine amp deaminase protein [Botrytis fragariae]|uniref:Putative adenosine amp deaminase protein n=1 Tax=Botrytis fragariae TaxID=1964551 RepID=A0A8H6B5T7_9HELO|nr:putative adenosine amp deaminase protein [Botrytis fragariae]KAF5879502.1 putative adenosine amp deaminase protein [Botrytis fragariae]